MITRGWRGSYSSCLPPGVTEKLGRGYQMEKKPLAGNRMSKERVTKPDGRYLIFYRFLPSSPGGPQTAQVASTQGGGAKRHDKEAGNQKTERGA